MTATSASPAFAVSGVSKRYGDRVALAPLTLRIERSEAVAIVGPSGSGKSSIVRLLLRMVCPTDGIIYLGGVSLTMLQLSYIRNAIAVIPQEPSLFNASIAFNIGIGKAGSGRTDIIRAARIAHIHDFIVRLPDGYDTPVGERGLKLSGGERQRIAIARAIVRSPQVYVFDEATSSLDTRLEAAILTSLSAEIRESTTLFIAHRLTTVVDADEILVLNNGRIVERGQHCDLLGRGDCYTEMWHSQLHLLMPSGN